MRVERKDFVSSFDRYVQIISFATKNKRRIGSKEVSELVGVHQRSAQRYLTQLKDYGYLICDGESPAGYVPTEKTKEIFGVKA